MVPAASVSGLYFGHSKAKYFAIDLLTRDQIQDYARRKGIPQSDAEKWLQSYLGSRIQPGPGLFPFPTT